MKARLFRLTRKEREHLQRRDEVIAALGMPPEDRTSRDSRYAFTTGEFIRDLRLENGDTEATRLIPWAFEWTKP